MSVKQAMAEHDALLRGIAENVKFLADVAKEVVITSHKSALSKSWAREIRSTFAPERKCWVCFAESSSCDGWYPCELHGDTCAWCGPCPECEV